MITAIVTTIWNISMYTRLHDLLVCKYWMIPRYFEYYIQIIIIVVSLTLTYQQMYNILALKIHVLLYIWMMHNLINYKYLIVPIHVALYAQTLLIIRMILSMVLQYLCCWLSGAMNWEEDNYILVDYRLIPNILLLLKNMFQISAPLERTKHSRFMSCYFCSNM